MKCSPLSPGNVEGALRTMLQTQANYVGLSTAQLCAAICSDAIADIQHRKIVVVTAEDNDEVAGYVIATIGGANHFIRFARRYPLIMLQAILKSLKKKILPNFKVSAEKAENVMKAVRYNSLPFVTTDSSSSWRDRDANIARIIHIGVRPEFRGRGVAIELYRYLYGFLQNLGVTRIDANIDKYNIASIRMHHNAGWAISTNGSHLFATIDLRHEN